MRLAAGAWVRRIAGEGGWKPHASFPCSLAYVCILQPVMRLCACRAATRGVATSLKVDFVRSSICVCVCVCSRTYVHTHWFIVHLECKSWVGRPGRDGLCHAWHVRRSWPRPISYTGHALPKGVQSNVQRTLGLWPWPIWYTRMRWPWPRTIQHTACLTGNRGAAWWSAGLGHAPFSTLHA